MNKLRYCIFCLIVLATISNCIAWQESDFYGTYDMNHDGWEGTLYLHHNLEYDLGQSSYNLIGTYTGSDNTVVGVRGKFPSDPNENMNLGMMNYRGDNMINFFIDSVDPNEGPQEFWGYLYSNNRAMAGITWWHNRPFGFYAIKS